MRIFAILMARSPLGLNGAYINTKENIIADAITRPAKGLSTQSHLDSLLVRFPELQSCQRFEPHADLLDMICSALCTNCLPDVKQAVPLGRLVPGAITSKSGATTKGSATPA
jgi:hypothetical protein